MRSRYLIFFVFLTFALFGIGCCAAEIAGIIENSSQKPEYWINLDPLQDKHVNDSFVITGSTNFPVDEPLRIGIYSTLMHSGKYPSPRWYREDIVPIQRGIGENNTFTSPLITPMIDIKDPKFYATYPDGTKMTVWLEGEYYVKVEYFGNASISENAIGQSTCFNIIPDETLASPATLDKNTSPSGGKNPSTHPSPSILPAGLIAVVGIIGFFACLMRKRN
jgi:hypothetical protein